MRPLPCAAIRARGSSPSAHADDARATAAGVGVNDPIDTIGQPPAELRAARVTVRREVVLERCARSRERHTVRKGRATGRDAACFRGTQVETPLEQFGELARHAIRAERNAGAESLAKRQHVGVESPLARESAIRQQERVRFVGDEQRAGGARQPGESASR